jgi:transposase
MLEMEEQFMIRRLKDDGLSISAISREIGCCRATVRKFLRKDTLMSYKPRAPKEKKLDPYRKYIEKQLDMYEEMSAWVLFERIQAKGYTGGYTTVKDFVRPIKKAKRILAEIRFETGPGIQAQVDWGDVDTIMVDGVPTNLYCFTMVLGYSRQRYTIFTLDTTTETFLQCHLHAFEYFGGVTKEILYDNTKNVVLKRALRSSDSQWNPMFEDFFRHFGFMPRLCKPGKEGAKTKGKVEALVKYVKYNFYIGREYDSLIDLNNQAFQWMEKVNRLPHGTTKIPPVERLAEEKLGPFDQFSPYQIVRTEYRKISRDCYFSYMGNLYSVPWKYAGFQVELRIQNRKMLVFVNGNNICEHTRREGSGMTVRVSDHFDGLLKEKMSRNKENHRKRIESLKVKAPEVERRPLVEYDVFMEGE